MRDFINVRAPIHEFAKSLSFKTMTLLLSSHFKCSRYFQLNVMIKIVMRDFLLKINGFLLLVKAIIKLSYWHDNLTQSNVEHLKNFMFFVETPPIY